MIGHDELIVDLFAGGGGASAGIRDALGRDPDVVINHDPVAVVEKWVRDVLQRVTLLENVEEFLHWVSP